jgi:hypothetical protein
MDLKFLLLEDAGRPAGTIAVDAEAIPEELRPRHEPSPAGEAGEGLSGFVLLERDAGTRQALARILPQLVGRMREHMTSRRERDIERILDALLLEPLLPDPPDAAAEQAFVIGSIDRRQAFLDEWPCLTAEQVHRNAGFGARNTSAAASRWKAAGEILSVRAGKQDLYPAFQFRNGRPLPGLKPLLDMFAGRRDGWQIALWLTTGNGWLPGGGRPVDLLERDPEAVLQAARMAMAEPAA